MIVSFEKIVDKFISRYGIRTVVVKTEYVEENRCEISLHGGYSTCIEVIDDILYKDGMPYCRVEELFG